jgi:chromosome segregation ATPase
VLLDDEKAEVERLRAENTRLNYELGVADYPGKNELVREVKRLRSEKDRLEQLFFGQGKNNEELRAEVEKWSKTALQADREVERLRASLGKSGDLQARRVAELQAEVERLEEENDALRGAVAGLREQGGLYVEALDDKDAEFKSASDAVAYWKDYAGAMEREVERLRADWQVFAAERDRLIREQAERFDQIQGERDSFGHQLARTNGEVERLRASEGEAWEKASAWHHLLRDQVCVYCREPLLSGTGPPCRHQKHLRRASLARAGITSLEQQLDAMQADLDERLAEVERLRAEVARLRTAKVVEYIDGAPILDARQALKNTEKEPT